MICVVRCNKKTAVRLPDGISKSTGEVVTCPEQCPYKNSICAKTSNFKAISSKTFDDEDLVKAFRVVEYTQAEKVKFESSLSSDDSIDARKNDADISGITIPTASSHEEISSTSAPKVGMIFGTSKRTNINEVQEEKLLPRKTYSEFVIGGKIYSDDANMRRDGGAQPLKNALEAIFTFWETRCVFQNNQLRDEFIWLATTVLKRDLYAKDFENILDDDTLSDSQKFFYIYYDIIYKYSTPKGFYWCNDRMSMTPLTSYFKGRLDFAKHYCANDAQGTQFRYFYSLHKKEILHYLGAENEETLFQSITLEYSKNSGYLIWFDPSKNYLPMNFGNASSFAKKMQVPNSFDEMQAMVRFFERFRLSRAGLVVRSNEFVFEKSERNGLQEDESMYRALKLASSASYASEYDARVTLLREYMKTYNPTEIKIGTLTFTKSNFSGEIKKVVQDFCKARFGQVDELVWNLRKGEAWLVKSLFERNILCTFECENRRYVSDLMNLIADPTLERYFSLYTIPVIQIGKNDYTMSKYIENMLNEDVYTANGIFSEDIIINAYLNYKLAGTAPANLDNMLSTYQKQYEDFINF